MNLDPDLMEALDRQRGILVVARFGMASCDYCGGHTDVANLGHLDNGKYAYLCDRCVLRIWKRVE